MITTMYSILLIQVIILYVLVSTLGSSVHHLIFGRLGKTEVDHVIPTSMYGLAILTVISWYWFELLSYGIVPLAYALLLAIFLLLLIPRFRSRVAHDFKIQIKESLPPIALSFLVYTFCGRYLFSNFGSNVGSNNGDVASYAQISQFLLHNGFGQSGNLIGLPAGVVARTDVTGTYTTVSFTAALLRIPIQEALNVSLLFSFVLIAVCAKRMLRMLGVRGLAANLISVLPQTIFIVAYLSWCFFLSQLLGISFMLAIFGLMNSKIDNSDSRRRDLLLRVGQYALLTSGLVLVYGHMSFVVMSVVTAVAALRLRKLTEISEVIVPALGGAIGLFIVFSKSQIVLQKAIAFAGDKANGWSLPYLLPSEILGFQWSENAKPTGTDFDLTLLLSTAAVFTFVFLYFKKSLNRFTPNLIGIFLVVIGYAYFLSKSQDSYVQWKWITFFIPIIVLTLYAALTEVLLRFLNKSVICALICLILVLNIMRYELHAVPARYGSPPSSDQINLGFSEKISPLKELNIKSGPHLRSMWPAVYLTGIRTAILDPTYYSTSQPLLAPTLVSADFPTAPFVNRDKINKTYDLVYPRTDQAKFEISSAKATIEIKEFASSFVVNSPNTLIVTVKNSGEVSWSGSGAFKGAVNLGVRTLSRNGLNHSQELAHCPIVEFPNYVNPKTVFEVDCAISFTESGKYEIELTPISEGEAWFSDVAPANRLVVLIDVK